jgi:hypothetical protein
VLDGVVAPVLVGVVVVPLDGSAPDVAVVPVVPFAVELGRYQFCCVVADSALA